MAIEKEFRMPLADEVKDKTEVSEATGASETAEKVADIVSAIEGVGKCEILITYDGAESVQIAYDEETVTTVTTDSDDNSDNKGTITIAGVTKDLTNRKAAPLEFTVSPLSLQGSIPFELTYKSAVKFALVTENATSISAMAQKGEPVAVQYYTLSGMQVDEPSKGFYIVRKVYGDGTAVAGKEYYK